MEISNIKFSKSQILLNFLKNILFFCIIFSLKVGFQSSNFNFSILNFVLLLALCIIEIRMTHKIYSPLFFWYIFWLGAIIISRMETTSYDFSSEWGDNLFNYVILNTVVFFFAFQVMSFLSNIIYFRDLNAPKNKIKKLVSLNYDKLYTATSLLLLIGNLFFILNVILEGNIPIFSSNPDAYRATFVNTFLFTIINFSRIGIIFVPLLLKSDISKIKKKRIFYSLFTTIIFSLLTAWRGYFFQIVILYLTADLGISKYSRKNFKQLLGFSIISAPIITIIGLYREGVNVLSVGIGGLVEYLFNIIYLYIAPNFLNFQQAINTLVPNYNFVYTTEALWSFVLPNSFFSSYQDLSFSIGGFNVSTYLIHPYADYGLLGTLIWTILIAMVGAYYFNKYSYKKNLDSLAIIGIINISVFFMHSNFFLRSSSVVIWILITRVIIKYLRTNRISI